MYLYIVRTYTCIEYQYKSIINTSGTPYYTSDSPACFCLPGTGSNHRQPKNGVSLCFSLYCWRTDILFPFCTFQMATTRNG